MTQKDKPLITIVGVLGKQGRSAARTLLHSGRYRAVLEIFSNPSQYAGKSLPVISAWDFGDGRVCGWIWIFQKRSRPAVEPRNKPGQPQLGTISAHHWLERSKTFVLNHRSITQYAIGEAMKMASTIQISYNHLRDGHRLPDRVAENIFRFEFSAYFWKILRYKYFPSNGTKDSRNSA